MVRTTPPPPLNTQCFKNWTENGERIGLSRGAQACDCKRDRLWVQFPLEEMKYLTLSFPRSGNELKRDVEFRHLTHNAFKNLAETGERKYLNRNGVS